MSENKIDLPPLDITPPSSPPRANSKFIVFAASVWLFLTVSVSLAYYLGTQKQPPVAVIPTPTIEPIVTQSVPPATSTPVSTSKLNLGNITWLSSPKVIKPLKVFETEGSDCVLNPSFQQTGTAADGTKIVNLIYTNRCGMGDVLVLTRFAVLPDGQIFHLVDKISAYYPDTNLQDIKLAENDLGGISSPESFSTKYGTISKQVSYFDDTISFTQLRSPSLIEDTKYGHLYVDYTLYSPSDKLDVPLSNRRLTLRLADDTVVRYEVDPGFFTDDRVPQITWSNGVTNSDLFTIGPYKKCGASSSDILRPGDIRVADITLAGVTKTGQTIYKFTNKNLPVVQKMYQSYPYDASNPDREFSVDNYLEYPTHFLWQDGLGDWHVFLNDKYTIQAECGKPVIYLYPQQDTQVTVKVGANITLSEPLYPQQGWTVLAHPNSQLDYQGASYPNLFWEGTGQGTYNSHFGEGYVVSQQELIPTIYSHLSKLGLNSQESADFMEFWQSRLPTTPYVRLTWLNTTDMNQLAPLSVSPRPDTVIRLFLDFEGLDHPTRLTPQRLTAPPRHGFTLVEWGGLLVK